MSHSTDKTSSDETPQRHLSPHIQIYRWTLTMIPPTLQRATGIALYAGTLLLVWWLMAAANGPEAFALFQSFAGSWIGQMVLFGYTWALFHHMFGGIKHFIWDTGAGFELSTVEWISRGATLIPILLTLMSWVLAYKFMGAF